MRFISAFSLSTLTGEIWNSCPSFSKFIDSVWFPLHKTQELSELFFNQVAKGLPPFIKKWQVFFGQDGLEGGKAYHLIMVEKGKVDEGYIHINKINQPMAAVEGWNCRIEPLLGMKDVVEVTERS